MHRPQKIFRNIAFIASCTWQHAMQALRNFRILRVMLAVVAGACLATSMSTAVLGAASARVPALFAAAALASSALAAVANSFVRLLTFKPYYHYKH